MSLISYIIFFILYNIYSSQKIQFDTSCSSSTSFNSLKYSCDVCPNGNKSPYTCYRNGISIYTFERNNLLTKICNSGQMIELDGNRKLLETPQCMEKEFNYNDIDISSSGGGSFGTTIDNSNFFSYTGYEQNYYESACLEGYYERGCDYSANLCALSLYNSNNYFCSTIIKKLNEKLNLNNIL